MGKSEKKKRNRAYIYDDKGAVSPHSDEFRALVALEYLSGRLTRGETARKYSVSGNSVASFARWYKKNGQFEPPISKPMTVEEETELAKITIRLQETEKALKQADIRLVALESLITVAERELKIDIRKKSGTKRSKS